MRMTYSQKKNCHAKTRALDFALAMISAIRHDHDIHDPMTLREIALLSQVIVGANRGCTYQNILRIQNVALRKLYRTLSEKGLLQEYRQ